MKQTNKITFWATMLLLVVTVYSCKYYIKHDFRKTYTDVNKALHIDVHDSIFFKIHFNNGDVSVLDKWYVNDAQDSIWGNGTLYDFDRMKVQEGDLSFRIDDIAIIESNDLRAIKSKDKSRVAGLTILTAANLVMNFVCITNPKACFGSCPTFYIDDSDYVHDSRAEGFSNSISPSLERHDLDMLQHRTSDAEFYLTMKNEAFETHSVNKLSIEAVAVDKDKSVYHDTQGTYYQCGKVHELHKARVEDRNIRSAMRSIDEEEYFSLTDSTDLTTREEIIFEFNEVPATDLGLVVNYRQTLLTTFLLYSGIAYMGDEVGDYFARIETDMRLKKRLESPFAKLGKVDVYVWDELKSKWIFVEALYETGPISKNLIFAPLHKINHNGGPLKMKIEMAKGLWRIDYLGLAEIEQEVKPIKIAPSKIEVITGGTCAVDNVKADDDQYLVSFPGDEFRFQFDLPRISEYKEYELTLYSKGYYLEWVRDQWLKEKNTAKLKRMLMYNKNTWEELAIEFKTMEHEMETVFWNSTYSNIQ